MNLSVIIPVYNKELYIADLIEDLLNQTFTDFECILVDDGSTDKSGEICDRIVETDSRFKVFHIKNGGVSNARNFGIDKATGEYITFIDSDDRLYPEHFENLVTLISQNDVDFVISGLENYWMDSDKKTYTFAPYKGKKTKSEILVTFAQVQKDTGIFGFCVAKIFRKNLIDDIRFDTTIKLAEDFDFYLRIYKKIDAIYFDDKCYYRYLQFADNSSQIVLDEKIDYFTQLIIRLRFREFLISQGAYENDNKKIIDEMINNYVFFVLFYSPIDLLKERFNELKKVTPDELIDSNGKSSLKKIILFLYKNKQIGFIKLILSIRRILRNTVRKIRGA